MLLLQFIEDCKGLGIRTHGLLVASGPFKNWATDIGILPLFFILGISIFFSLSLSNLNNSTTGHYVGRKKSKIFSIGCFLTWTMGDEGCDVLINFEGNKLNFKLPTGYDGGAL